MVMAVGKNQGAKRDLNTLEAKAWRILRVNYVTLKHAGAELRSPNNHLFDYY